MENKCRMHGMPECLICELLDVVQRARVEVAKKAIHSADGRWWCEACGKSCSCDSVVGIRHMPWCVANRIARKLDEVM